ncbi:hypothetical protein [Beijerinckia indica]|uniref:hypothetical protein n=1 Tax=Beijerinckia indica TaxID=533 RepID=UPI0011D0F0BB|nr:hypothetical protein [Beijerinckia indica]
MIPRAVAFAIATMTALQPPEGMVSAVRALRRVSTIEINLSLVESRAADGHSGRVYRYAKADKPHPTHCAAIGEAAQQCIRA